MACEKKWREECGYDFKIVMRTDDAGKNVKYAVCLICGGDFQANKYKLFRHKDQLRHQNALSLSATAKVLLDD